MSLETVLRQQNTQLEQRLQEQTAASKQVNGDLERLVIEHEQLKSARSHFFEISLDLFGLFSRDGYFKLVNPAFERTLGYGWEEFLVIPLIDFVHPEDREATLRELKKLNTSTSTLHFENRYRCKDGHYKWLEWHCYPEKNGGLIYTVIRDLTFLQKSRGRITSQ